MRIITPKGMFIEGEFTPEQLATIIERAGIDAEDSAAVVAVEATPEEAAQAKEHPEQAWIDTMPKRPEPQAAKPQGKVVGGIRDTLDPDRGKRGFQFEMPREE
jgi:hypothetical protein